MIIIGILIAIARLGALCWLLFNLAVFALPFFVGVSAGLAALHSGAGPVGGILAGFAAGIATLVVGQVLFTNTTSATLRLALAALFAAPAAFAGYHAAHGLIALVTPAEAWRQTFAILGAIAVGLTAAARMTLPVRPSTVRPRLRSDIVAAE